MEIPEKYKYIKSHGPSEIGNLGWSNIIRLENCLESWPHFVRYEPKYNGAVDEWIKNKRLTYALDYVPFIHCVDKTKNSEAVDEFFMCFKDKNNAIEFKLSY